MILALLSVVEACGDIGVLTPFSARKDCCGSSYKINLDSANIISISSYPFGANLAATMNPSGNLVAMGLGGGIRIYTFPSLTLLSEIKTKGVVLDLEFVGDYLFVANGLEGLLVYDLTTPSSPSLVYHYDSPGYAKDVYINGGHLFLSDGEFGVKIFDITSPSSPVLVGSINTLGDANGVAVYTNYAFVSESYLGVGVYDISDMSSPVEVSRIGSIGDARAVYLDGYNLYIAVGTSGLKVYDVSNPLTPSLVSSISTSSRYTDVNKSSYIYSAAMSGGLDIINPYTMAIENNVSTRGVAYKISKVGNYLLVSEDMAGLEIYDITDPLNPSLVSFIEAEGCFYDVKASGDKLYAAAEKKGLKIFNYASPTPIKVAEVRGIEALQVFVSGGYIFVAAGRSGGLKIYDTSSLSLVGEYDTPGSAEGVFVSGNYAFVADGLYGVRIIDISDPTNPTEVSYYDSPGEAHKVFVEGNLMYVADGSAGLRIVDITDITSPTEISYYDSPGTALGVYVSYPYAFLADGGGSGIRVINVSDPFSPYEISQYTTPGEAKSVFVKGRYVFVADGIGGMRVLDISLLPTITEYGYYDTPWSAQNVFVDALNRIFTPDLSAGFLVLSFLNFTSVSETSVPDFVSIGGTRGGIVFGITSLVPGKANIKIYSTSGQEVYRKNILLRKGFSTYTLEFPRRGVYIVKVSLPSGRVRTGTVIVR